MMGIPINCKRLIEVDFPIVAVSEASAKEKDIKTGSFAAVHVWWARRPLAACRAMNLACMIPDPADANCPTELRKIIATALDEFDSSPNGQTKIFQSKKAWGADDDGDLSKSRNRPKSLRKRLLKFIGEYSRWDLKMSETHTKCARSMIIGCHGGNPKLLDSFAGGGSIPIEGQRIGIEAYATDINPIPLLLNTLQLTQLRDINNDKLNQIEDTLDKIILGLEREIGYLYPKKSASRPGETPTGYLCARTIICEGLTCGVQYPLLKSGWAVKSKKNKYAYRFQLKENNTLQISLTTDQNDPTIISSNIDRGNATCPICNHTTPVESVRRQLSQKNGGSNDSRLMAVVCTSESSKGRKYHTPTEEDINHRKLASDLLEKYLSDENFAKFLPDEEMVGNSRYLTPPSYGMKSWADMYSPRHALTLIILIREVSKIEDPITRLVLALTVSKFCDRNTTLCSWSPSHEKFLRTFASHRIQMSWDFYEPRPFGKGGSNVHTTFLNIIRGLNAARIPSGGPIGLAQYSDATNHHFADDSIDIWATDPPYYDAVPYSDISNYFIIVLKRMLGDLILEGEVAPRDNEVVMDKTLTSDGEIKNDNWYEMMVKKSLSEGRRITKPDGISYWVYAHKSTNGWATVLKGIISSGWMVTGSWPISTERKTRFRAQKSAALSTSVHIVMRPREENIGAGEWSEILNMLPGKLSKWLTRMKESGVMGADAIYSCIGPAMELFSKYDSVERASGEEVSIDEYLQYVWDNVADEAVKLLSPNSENSTAEPNARFSMMAIWTLRQSMNIDYTDGKTIVDEEIEAATEPSKLTIPFDTASLLARGIGAVIEDLEKNEVIDVKGAVVKILSPEDRRHYLLGVTNEGLKIQQKTSSQTQLKLGESLEEAAVRVNVETKLHGFIEMPKRDSQLDKLHQSMLLHADGNSVALEAHLRDIIGDDPAFWQLANTLNTLYPEGSWERSKIEGVIARYQSLR